MVLPKQLNLMNKTYSFIDQAHITNTPSSKNNFLHIGMVIIVTLGNILNIHTMLILLNGRKINQRDMKLQH